MLRIGLLIVFVLAGPGDDAWKAKPVAEWTEQDTKQILTDSPWAVATAPTVKKDEKRQSGNRIGGIGSGIGNGIGIPGVGRRHPNADQNTNSDSNAAATSDAPQLTLRWESALPIREAELKAREINAPVVDEDHYGIAVYGIPSHFTKDPQNAGDHLKGQAALKREGQKDLKPSHVDVILRDDGLVIVFLFPRVKEISANDATLEFNALIGQFQIAQSFHVGDMIYRGKLEL